MKYAIIGAGAVGAYFGGRLAQAGHDVHFLLRSDYDYVREQGLYVESYLGDFHLPLINVYNDSALMPKCDVVLVCMKTTANHSLVPLLSPILTGHTIVILVQNGIGVEADVQAMLPNVRLAAGVAFINAVKQSPGRILHAAFGHISFCDYSCHDVGVLSSIVSDFKVAGVKCRVADYAETRWRKNILNMATNGVTVVLNARCDELLAQNDSCQLVRDLMIEGVMAAQSCGVSAISTELVDQMIENSRNTRFATSMKYDYDNHLPMEIEYIYSRPISEAESRGCRLPKLRFLEQQLRFLDR